MSTEGLTNIEVCVCVWLLQVQELMQNNAKGVKV